MYRPLEPHVREFALTTLVALLRYDVRMQQISQVISIDLYTVLRSDVVLDALCTCLGATLVATRDGVFNAYITAAGELIAIMRDRRITRENAELFAAADVLISQAANQRSRSSVEHKSLEEAAVYTIFAEKLLHKIEDLAHLENRGTISERAKRRLTDRLAEGKKRMITADMPVAIGPPPAREIEIVEAEDAMGQVIAALDAMDGAEELKEQAEHLLHAERRLHAADADGVIHGVPDVYPEPLPFPAQAPVNAWHAQRDDIVVPVPPAIMIPAPAAPAVEVLPADPVEERVDALNDDDDVVPF